jgi:hypothetical protein
MSDPGATADLLEVAHATLREAVLPHVAAAARYEAAMVANAVAIVARELELGARTREAERDLLARFCGMPDAPLAELRARCCADLRAGRLDPAREPELRRLLHEVVHARLAISNPAYGRGGRERR